MSTAPEKDPIPAGHIRATNTASGLSHDIPKQAWEVLGKAGQAKFEQSVAKPSTK